jgi:hypothetical protein
MPDFFLPGSLQGGDRVKKFRSYLLPVLGCLAVFSTSDIAADLKEKTATAFDRYTAATEARIQNELRSGDSFLYVDSQPQEARKSSYEQLKSGEILVHHLETAGPGLSSEPPDGLIHHWVGLAFIPGATLANVLPIVRDYDRRAQLYKPEVTASHLIWHRGDDYKFFLRLYEKRFTTVVFNTEYVAHWGQVDPKKLYSHSISTKVAEVKDPNQPDGEELPIGEGHGYLWRLNTYWRFEERDGGVYVQCEALSLTRDIPYGLAWLLRPLVTKIPKDALDRALGETRKLVLQSMGKSAGQ